MDFCGESKRSQHTDVPDKTPATLPIPDNKPDTLPHPTIDKFPYFLEIDLPMENYHGNDGFGKIFSFRDCANLYAKQFQFTSRFVGSESNVGELRLLRCRRYLGSGGAGHCFLCQEITGATGQTTGQSYALKIFHKKDNEIQILQERHAQNKKMNVHNGIQMTHKNVVSVHNWTLPTDKSTHQIYMTEKMQHRAKYGYVVMDLGSCGELTSQYILGGCQVDTEAIPINILKKIMSDVLQGVAFMHSKHIVHRDIKPENMIVDCYGNVRLTDFGLVTIKRFQSPSPPPPTAPPSPLALGRLITSDAVKLTSKAPNLTYLAPELVQWNNNTSKINPNEYSDIWSCGVAMLLMHACEKPNAMTSSNEWKSFLGSGRKKSVYSTTPQEVLDFYQRIFRLQFRSERNQTNEDYLVHPDHYRPSAKELLSTGWLSPTSLHPMATNSEFAEYLLARNFEYVENVVLKSSPNDYRLLSLCVCGSGDTEVNTFFASLVGGYYRQKYEAPMEEEAATLLRYLGFQTAATALDINEDKPNMTIQRLFHDDVLYVEQLVGGGERTAELFLAHALCCMERRGGSVQASGKTSKLLWVNQQ